MSDRIRFRILRKNWMLSSPERYSAQYRFTFVDELLVERLIHDENVSHEPEQADVNAMIIVKYAAEIRRYPAVKRALYARWHQMRGTLARQRGDRAGTLRHHWAALRYRPTLFRLVLLILAVLGSRTFGFASMFRQRLLDIRLRTTTDRFWTRTHGRTE